MKCEICEKETGSDMPICESCMLKAKLPGELQNDTEELKEIAGILAITSDTDKNIKIATESILNVAYRLKERARHERLSTKDRKSETAHSREDV